MIRTRHALTGYAWHVGRSGIVREYAGDQNQFGCWWCSQRVLRATVRSKNHVYSGESSPLTLSSRTDITFVYSQHYTEKTIKSPHIVPKVYDTVPLVTISLSLSPRSLTNMDSRARARARPRATAVQELSKYRNT